MGEIIGELSSDSKGFRAENVTILRGLKIAVAKMRAVGEQGAESRIPGVKAGAEDGLGIVEEDSGGRTEAHAVDQD